jgi:RNA-binding protein NOB1
VRVFSLDFFVNIWFVYIIVTNYAKKTGDYAFLSAVDLRLLALTYQLYQENVGTDKLNLEPKMNVNFRMQGNIFVNVEI